MHREFTYSCDQSCSSKSEWVWNVMWLTLTVASLLVPVRVVWSLMAWNLHAQQHAAVFRVLQSRVRKSLLIFELNSQSTPGFLFSTDTHTHTHTHTNTHRQKAFQGTKVCASPEARPQRSSPQSWLPKSPRHTQPSAHAFPLWIERGEGINSSADSEYMCVFICAYACTCLYMCMCLYACECVCVT